MSYTLILNTQPVGIYKNILAFIIFIAINFSRLFTTSQEYKPVDSVEVTNEKQEGNINEQQNKKI